MQRLPAELHGRIFVECLPDGPYIRPAGNTAPLLLLQVCRQWREVALQTTQLWRSLDAVQDVGYGELDPVRCERMGFYRGWLSRSGNCPLSMAVSFSDHPWLRGEWLQAVRCYRERFERLRIVDGAGLDVNLLLGGNRNLKHLAIQAHSQEGDRVLTIAQPQPCLHTLVLDSLHASPVTLPEAAWANLTRLAVRLPDEVTYELDEFLRLLNRCPNLETLIFGPVAVRSFRQPSRSYPSLRSFSITFDDNDSEALEDPLSALVLPGLLELRVLCDLKGDLEEELVSDEDLGPPTPDGPTDSNEQEPPSAAILPERNCWIRVESGDACFAMFDLYWTNVTHLDIEVAGSTGVLGRVLALCPNLRVLSLYGRHCTACCTSLPGPLSHSMLSSLSVTVWADFGNLLFEATLPGLREFMIFTTSYGQPGDIRDFLIRSRCPLEILTVKARGSRAWTAEEQAELLELIPTLNQLELNT